MQTLVEFVRFTKGWEYITAVAFILTFISFWRLLSRERAVSVESPFPKEEMIAIRQPVIALKRGGQFVGSGTFFNLKTWEFTVVPKPWGYLPGNREQRYLSIHPALAVVMGPLFGLLYIIMLPPVGVGMIAVSVSRRLYRQAARAARFIRSKAVRTTVR